MLKGGTQEKDKFNCVAVGKDGSAVLAGFSRGAWDGFISGSQDFAAVKIDSDGSELWKWQVKRSGCILMLVLLLCFD